MYLRHLQKESFLLGQPINWMSPEVKTIATGLANAQDKSFQFPNFTQSKDLIAILRHAKLDNELGQLFLMAYLLSLRSPSEALTTRRAFANDPLVQFTPQEDKALIGIRTYKKTDILVMKFPYRGILGTDAFSKDPASARKRAP